MIVGYETPVVIEGVPPRCTTTKLALCRTRLRTEVREVPEAVAPIVVRGRVGDVSVVMRSMDGRIFRQLGKSPQDVERWIRTRMFSFVTPRINGLANGDRDVWPKGLALAGLLSEDLFDGTRSFLEFQLRGMEPPSPKLSHFSVMTDKNPTAWHEWWIDEAKATAEACIFCDGEFWAETEHPFVMVSPFGTVSLHDASYHQLNGGYARHLPPPYGNTVRRELEKNCYWDWSAMCVPLSQVDNVDAVFGRLPSIAKALKETWSQNVSLEMKVALPRLCDHEALELIRLARSFMIASKRRNLCNGDVLDWVESLTRAKTSPRYWAEKLEAPVSQILESIRHGILNGVSFPEVGKGMWTGNISLPDALEAALNAWEEREISLESLLT